MTPNERQLIAVDAINAAIRVSLNWTKKEFEDVTADEIEKTQLIDSLTFSLTKALETTNRMFDFYGRER